MSAAYALGTYAVKAYFMSTEDDLSIARNHFADNLKKRRISGGYTQVEFSKLLGIEQGLLSRLENGARGFTSESLTEYASKLNIQPWELLLPPDISESKLRLISAIRRLPDARIATLLSLLPLDVDAVSGDQSEMPSHKRR